MVNPLPADLPENWSLDQIVSPSGTDVGLTAKHGYNYLMKQVNDAQRAVSDKTGYGLGEASKDISNQDWLDVLSQNAGGWYSGHNVTNAPTTGLGGTFWYTFIVSPLSEGNKYQTCIATHVYSGKTYTGYRYNGVWGGWSEIAKTYTSLGSMGLSDANMSPSDFGANVLAMINATAHYSAARFVVGSSSPNLLASIKAYLNDTNNDYFFELFRSTSASLPNKIFIVRNQANSLQPLWYSTYDDGLPPPINLSTGFVSKTVTTPQDIAGMLRAPIDGFYAKNAGTANRLNGGRVLLQNCVDSKLGGSGHCTVDNYNDMIYLAVAGVSNKSIFFKMRDLTGSREAWHSGNFPVEEGTFTPQFNLDTINGNRYGYYYRRGNRVCVEFGLEAQTNPGTDNTIVITGLPFAPAWNRRQYLTAFCLVLNRSGYHPQETLVFSLASGEIASHLTNVSLKYSDFATGNSIFIRIYGEYAIA